MTIFILEDQVNQATYLQHLLADLINDYHYPNEKISVHYKGSDLLLAAQQSTERNLYFLDTKIKTDAEAGLKIAQAIRVFDAEGIIVFVTTHQQLAYKSYQYMVSALTFVNKNLEKEAFQQQIRDCLAVYFTQNGQEKEKLVLEFLSTPLSIDWRELNFFEVVGNHMIRVNAGKRFVEFYGALSDIEKLDTRLWRVHQAFVINSQQISHFNLSKREIVLKNDSRIPVTRTYYKRLKEQLKTYEGDTL